MRHKQVASKGPPQLILVSFGWQLHQCAVRLVLQLLHESHARSHGVVEGSVSHVVIPGNVLPVGASESGESVGCQRDPEASPGAAAEPTGTRT